MEVVYEIDLAHQPEIPKRNFSHRRRC